MTRFARAAGSKSSNAREAEAATPWQVMKKQILVQQQQQQQHNPEEEDDDEPYAFGDDDGGESGSEADARPSVAARSPPPPVDGRDDDAAGNGLAGRRDHQQQQPPAPPPPNDDQERNGAAKKKKNPRNQNKCLNCKAHGHLKKDCPQLSAERRAELNELLEMKLERKGLDDDAKRKLRRAKKEKSAAQPARGGDAPECGGDADSAGGQCGGGADDDVPECGRADADSGDETKKRERATTSDSDVDKSAEAEDVPAAEKDAKAARSPDPPVYCQCNRTTACKPPRVCPATTAAAASSAKPSTAGGGSVPGPATDAEKLRKQKERLAKKRKKQRERKAQRSSEKSPQNANSTATAGGSGSEKRKKTSKKKAEKSSERQREFHKMVKKDKAGQVVADGEGTFQGFRVKASDAVRLRELSERLQREGVKGEEIKAALKKERRRAEKELARDKKLVCYNCREPGHFLAACPAKPKEIAAPAAAENAGAEIAGAEDARGKDVGARAGGPKLAGHCFKCNSVEHTSKDCPSKLKGADAYRFAECFICKETGHLAKACPDNPTGLYPNGGGCRFCGSVEHLKSDCRRKSSKDSAAEIRVGTLGGGAQQHKRGLEDVDEPTAKDRTNKVETKRKKVVKF